MRKGWHGLRLAEGRRQRVAVFPLCEVHFVSSFETRVTVLCVTALLTLAGPPPAQAQQPRIGVIKGVVVDSSDGVLPGVVVSALGSDGRTISTTVTAGEGDFAFERLPAGAIELSFHLSGFEDARATTVVPAGDAAGSSGGSTLKQILQLKTLSETVVVRGDPPPPPPKPRPVLQPVVEHDPSAVCGPAKVEAVMPSPVTVLAKGDSSRGLFGARDELVIEGGSQAGIRVGDNFIVRRHYTTPILDKKRRPVMGEHSSGLVQIVAVDDELSTALVVYACDEIASGDYLVPFAPEPASGPEPIGAPSFDAAVRILFADYGKGLGIANRMLVIDQGTLAGVRTGQRFTLFRRSRVGPSRPVVLGEAVVVSTRRESSTIRIEHASDVVFPGLDGDWAAPHMPLQRASQ